MHVDDLTIEPETVRALLRRSAPELASLPLMRFDSSGSSNAMFRLGDELLVRLPRQPGGGESIRKEARWGASVASRLPVATPEVVHLGKPSRDLGEAWSIVTWLSGNPPRAGEASRTMAQQLAQVVLALRSVEVPAEAAADPGLRWYRGLPLVTRDEDTRRHLEECRGLPGLDLDLDLAEDVWDEAMRLPGVAEPCPDAWCHGDLVAENLLVDGAGRLAAVLDFGALSIGDPTIDLHGVWELFDRGGRSVFRAALDVDEGTWLRGRAWALSIALMTFPYYWESMPDRCADRLVMARAVLEDADY